jgi:glucokinase
MRSGCRDSGINRGCAAVREEALLPESASANAFGIVIGGTTTTVALVSSSGQLRSQMRLATQPRDGFAPAMTRIQQAVVTLAEAQDIDFSAIAGLGIGCTGPVDTNTGVVMTDYTLPSWKGNSITVALSEAFQLPAVIANNADTAVLGEGTARNLLDKKVVLLTLGTGVGGGLLINGDIYQGAQGEHPEIGHIIVRGVGARCYCGSLGCLEMVASGSAIGASGRRIGLASAERVFEEARLGSRLALRIVETAIQCTARGVWTLFHTFLPDVMVLGGGVMEAHFDLFEPSIRALLAKSTMIPLNGVQVVQAMPGNNGGLIGAAALIQRQIRGSQR